MSYPTPQPVVSGVPYTVVDVDGRTPSELDDVVGPTVALTVEGTTGRHTIRGAASRVDGTVRLYEKAEDGVGKDMRTWRIDRDGDGALIAHTV